MLTLTGVKLSFDREVPGSTGNCPVTGYCVNLKSPRHSPGQVFRIRVVVGQRPGCAGPAKNFAQLQDVEFLGHASSCRVAAVMEHKPAESCFCPCPTKQHIKRFTVYAKDALAIKPTHRLDRAACGWSKRDHPRASLSVPDFDAVGLQVRPFKGADFARSHAGLQGEDKGAANCLRNGGWRASRAPLKGAKHCPDFSVSKGFFPVLRLGRAAHVTHWIRVKPSPFAPGSLKNSG